MTWGHAVKQTVPRGDLLRSLPSGVPLGWMDGTVEVGRDHMSGGLGCQIGDDLAGRSPPSTSRYVACWGYPSNRRRFGGAEPPQYLTAYRYHPIAGGYRMVYGVGRATGSIRGGLVEWIYP